MTKTSTHGLKALLLTVMVAVGCTKKVDYDYENKERVHTKSEISTSEEYLYVPTTGNSTRTAESARPYWQGDEKLVKFQFTEKALQVVEVDRETRFADNQTNSKLVLEIPVEHIQYKCATNSYGDCTQKETQDTDLNWSSRNSFKPDLNGIKIVEQNTLPIELEKLFSGGCYSESDSKFLDYQIKKDKINIRYEKTFTADPNCLSEFNSFSDLTLSQIYQYSFVKLNSIASADFKPVAYPQTDENTFGFFTTRFTKLDVDNNTSEKDQVVLMNHWNPNKKEIEYYLSTEFNKPENESLKKATELAVQRINQGFEIAGVDLKIVLKTSDGSVLPGDISKSMIILVEDPSAAGLFGYGPSATNPRTGEILSARTVIYKGILEQSIKQSYDEIRRDKMAERAGTTLKLSKFTAAPGVLIEKQAASATTQAKVNVQTAQQKISSGRGGLNLSPELLASSIKSAEKQIKTYTRNTNATSNQLDYVLAKSRHCMYAPEALSVDEKVREKISKIMGDKLTAWEDLSSSNKQEVLDILLPAAYLPTLIHELGHNLGLRHNFQGSEDKDNFYTQQELAKLGITHAIPHSSVMEYGASELSLLQNLGKYDIAALKFGYARKVETADNKIVDVTSTLEDLERSSQVSLKQYGYCTDEHVGINAGCKRFDAGTSYTEIAQFLIKQYQTWYFTRNFRNQRINFSVINDVAYASRINSTFQTLRVFFEVRERLVRSFNMSAADFEKLANQYAEQGTTWLKDINDAAKLSANFFLDVLKTPDLTCALAAKNKPNEILYIMTIDQLKPYTNQVMADVASCWELEMASPDLVIVGSYGKSFKSRKSRFSTNSYVDQIDVRGVWPDKVLAARTLFTRSTGVSTFDKYIDNYTDLSPEIGDEIVNTIFGMALNTTSANVTIVDKEGMPLLTGEVPVDIANSHIIPKALYSGIAKAIGVPAEESDLTKTLLADVVAASQSSETRQLNSDWIADLFKVHKTSTNQQLDADFVKNSVSLVDGSVRYSAARNNELSGVLIQNLTVENIIADVAAEKRVEIFSARAKGAKAPADIDTLPEGEQFLWKADLNLLNMVLNSALTPAQAKKMLNYLPTY